MLLSLALCSPTLKTCKLRNRIVSGLHNDLDDGYFPSYIDFSPEYKLLVEETDGAFLK